MSAIRRGPVASVINVVKISSVSLSGASIVCLALIMLAEATMRYVFTDPLGWNISVVERILMPVSVFLALPWLYITAGHVSAEIVYERLPFSLRRVARIFGHILLLVIAATLTYGGMVTVIDAFVLHDAPPPGSSEVPISSWIWELSQPVGAGALFLVALLDSRRIISEDGALETTDEDAVTIMAAESDEQTEEGGQS